MRIGAVCAIVAVGTCLPLHGQPSQSSPPPRERAAVVAGQAPVPPAAPPRDPRAPSPAASPVGLARIFGRVVDAASSRPLRGALVVAVPHRPGGVPLIDGRPTAAYQPIATRTDDDGQFALSEVPAGEYSVVARRAGYVDKGIGQATPSTPARRLVVEDQASAGPIEFALVRSAVISGRVVDPTGEPATHVTVRAARLRLLGGRWRMQPVESATTDDLGEFRLFGLSPGSYVVSADPPRVFAPPGTFVEMPERGTVATFAPSVTNPAEAQAVPVAAGEEAEAHIHLVEAAVATLEGRVLDSRDAPVNDGSVHLQPRDGLRVTQSLSASVHSDGTFTLHGVLPGAYTIVTSPRFPPGTADERAAIAARSEFGALDVEVSGDLSGLVVRTRPGSTVRGRLVVDGDASALRGREVRVQATSIDPWGPWNAQARARVLPDLTFELLGVRGAAVLRLGNAPEGWWTRAVRVGRVDTTDGHDFGMARTIGDVEIVVSTKATGLRGRVSGSARVPAFDAVVIGFEEDERKWGRPVVSNTFMVRPVEDGSWFVDMIRPGTYRLVALSAASARGEDLADPEYLRQLRPLGRTVVIAEGRTPDVILEVEEP